MEPKIDMTLIEKILVEEIHPAEFAALIDEFFFEFFLMYARLQVPCNEQYQPLPKQTGAFLFYMRELRNALWNAGRKPKGKS